jgi:hypothetical protein
MITCSPPGADLRLSATSHKVPSADRLPGCRSHGNMCHTRNPLTGPQRAVLDCSAQLSSPPWRRRPAPLVPRTVITSHVSEAWSCICSTRARSPASSPITQIRSSRVGACRRTKPCADRHRTVAARGEALFGACIAARMLQHFGGAATSPPFSEPTERETEVLGLLAAGPGQRWVARRLGAAPRRCITTHPTSSPSCTSPTGQEPFSGQETSAWAEPGRAELPLPTWCQQARVP